jgi:hypothetical protein
MGLLRSAGSLDRITLLIPTHDALIENLHVAISFFMENAIGQTGQVMGAGSVEDHRPVPGHIR